MCVFHKETNHLANTIQIACMFCYKEVPYVGIYKITYNKINVHSLPPPYKQFAHSLLPLRTPMHASLTSFHRMNHCRLWHIGDNFRYPNHNFYNTPPPHYLKFVILTFPLTPPQSPGYNNHNKFRAVIICTHITGTWPTFHTLHSHSDWSTQLTCYTYGSLLETCHLFRRRVTCSGDVLLAQETCHLLWRRVTCSGDMLTCSRDMQT